MIFRFSIKKFSCLYFFFSKKNVVFFLHPFVRLLSISVKKFNQLVKMHIVIHQHVRFISANWNYYKQYRIKTPLFEVNVFRHWDTDYRMWKCQRKCILLRWGSTRRAWVITRQVARDARRTRRDSIIVGGMLHCIL